MLLEGSLTDFDFRQFRYFVTVAEEGQMTRAARRLRLAQPALSQAIARLEAQVGVKLLDRNPRGVALTSAGHAFVEKARAALEAVDAAEATAHPLAAHDELTVDDVVDETFPGVAEWCDPGWLGYWGLDRYRGGPAKRTEDVAASPQELASIVASGRAITTVPEVVALPFGPMGI